MSLNVSQNIFTIFFAIFWGTVSSAWPRWKPFHWGLGLFKCKTGFRLVVALSLLNVFPLFFAGVTLHCLSVVDDSNYNPYGVVQWLVLFIVSVVPAFSIFGMSRMFAALMALSPCSFYYSKEELESMGLFREVGHKFEPDLESLGLENATIYGVEDFSIGVMYVVMSACVAVFCEYFLSPFF